MDFSSYNIGTVNINTITNSNKLDSLRTFIRSMELDIVFMQEVENEQLSIPGFNVLCNVDNRHRGTAIALKSHINFTHVEKSLDGRLIAVRVNNVTLCCVYAHSGNHMRNERERFLNNTVSYYLRHSTPHIILAGDFNCILRQCDGTGSNFSPSLQATTNQLQLKDVWMQLKPRIPGYTHITHHSASRLDRIYVSQGLTNQLQTIDTHVCAFSDHKAVTSRILLPSLGREPGRGFWTLRTHLLTVENIEELQSRWQYWTRQRHHYRSWMQWWISFAKPRIQSFFRWKSKAEYDRYHYKYQRLYATLRQAYDDLPGHPEILVTINRLKSELLILQRHFTRTFVRANESFLAGEPISSFQLGDRKRKKTTITTLMDEQGINIERPEEIERHILAYFQDLYTDEEMDAAAEEEFLSDQVIPNDDEANIACTNEITTADIWQAIKTSAANKSPGPDGIPREFYLRAFDVIHREMNLVLNEALHGNFTSEFLTGVIVLVKKKGAGDTIKAYRPISLLNVDYKVLSRILKTRLEAVMREHRVIGEVQKCGNVGKNIFQATLSIKDKIAQMIQRKQKGKLVSFDLENAFDRVSRRFLSKTMTSLGFNRQLITLLDNIAARSTSQIMINGKLSQSFPIQRSVRQGDPLSMTLFVLYLHPLLRKLEQVCGTDLIVAYADDISVLATSADKLERMMILFQRFGCAGGARLNLMKTSAIDVGFIDDGVLPVPWLNTDYKIKILGVFFANSIRVMIKLNWDSVIANFSRLTWLHSLRSLTLHQKVSLLNTYITSKIWYISSILPAYSKHTAKITAIIGSFLWNRSPFRVPLQQLARKQEDGGLKLQLPLLKSKALLINRHIQEKESIPFYTSYFDGGNNQPATIPADLQCLKVLRQYLEIIPDHIRQNPCSSSIHDVFVNQTDIPKVERNNPVQNWKRIWKNVNDSHIATKTRSKLYLITNEKVATRKLLYVTGRADGENCNHCGATVETIQHKYSECRRATEAWNLTQRRISAISGGWRRFSFNDLLQPTLNGVSRRYRNKMLELFTIHFAFVDSCENIIDINELESALQYGM